MLKRTRPEIPWGDSWPLIETINPTEINSMTKSVSTTTNPTNQIINVSKVFIGGESANSVDARELHEFLEVNTAFSDWIKKRINEYGFVNDSDYLVISNRNHSGIGNAPIDYAIKIDMAKELSMVERNEKGRQARKYFIAMEKVAKNLPISVQLPETVQCQLMGAEILSRMLNYSESSKIDIIGRVYSINNLSCDFLPAYAPDVKVVFSATVLLKNNDCELSARAFNNLLVAQGYLEEKTRPSTRGTVKTFKALTEKGMEYGQNDVSPHSKLQVQPHFYEVSFMDLYSIVTGD